MESGELGDSELRCNVTKPSGLHLSRLLARKITMSLSVSKEGLMSKRGSLNLKRPVWRF